MHRPARTLRIVPHDRVVQFHLPGIAKTSRREIQVFRSRRACRVLLAKAKDDGLLLHNQMLCGVIRIRLTQYPLPAIQVPLRLFRGRHLAEVGIGRAVGRGSVGGRI